MKGGHVWNSSFSSYLWRLRSRSPWLRYRRFGSSCGLLSSHSHLRSGAVKPNHHGRFLRRCKQLLRGQSNAESNLEMLKFGFPRVFHFGFQVCKHTMINSLEALTIFPMAWVLTAILGKEEDGLNPLQLIFCWDPQEVACQRAFEVNVVLWFLWQALLSALASVIVQNWFKCCEVPLSNELNRYIGENKKCAKMWLLNKKSARPVWHRRHFSLRFGRVAYTLHRCKWLLQWQSTVKLSLFSSKRQVGK